MEQGTEKGKSAVGVTTRLAVIVTASARGGESMAPAQQEQHAADHSEPHCDLHIPPVVMDRAVAGTGGPTNAGERECPNRGADQREQRVRDKPHLEDAGGDGDKRADERRDPAEEDAGLSPAFEPVLGNGETFRREVEPATVILEQRAAPAASMAQPTREPTR